LQNETVWSFCIPQIIKFGEGAVEEIGYDIEARIRFAHIARLMGENVEGLSVKEAANKAALAVRELALDIGIPKNLEEFGCKEKDAPRLAKETLKIQRLLVGNPRKLRVEDLEEIFCKAIKGEL